MAMKQEELVGKAQTVLGTITPESLGITMPHEHILITFTSAFRPPDAASDQDLAYQQISLQNLNWVKRNFAKNIHNLKLQDEQEMTDEVMFYKKTGGQTIVDVTPSLSLGRDPLGLQRISRITGINIILGTGYYETYTGYENSFVVNKSEEELAELVIHDILVGIDDTGVRAGIIGENGLYYPFSDIQQKVVRAVTHAQRYTGAAINIHSPLYASTKLPQQKDHEELMMAIVKTIADTGGDLNRTVISHIDVCCFRQEFLIELADTGCYLEFDTFGVDGNLDTRACVWGTPNDWRRVEQIMQLIEQGFLNQVLVSCDHCTKMQLRRYGGWGYDHILTSVVPIMQVQGMTEKQIRMILIENPKRILTFVPARQ